MTSRFRRPAGAVATAVAIALTAAATAAAAACGGGTSDLAGAGAGNGPITVVASTTVWAGIAAAVGGDRVRVTAVISDPAADPHSYQVSAKDAARLRDAELVVYNGGGYDDWVEQALGDSRQRRIKAVDLRPAKNVDDNEHVWYDLPTVAMVTGELASQLSLLRPAEKPTFIANADAYDRRLDELESQLGDLAVSGNHATVAATEPAAHYLLQAARLTDATPPDFAQAVEEETDPPAAAVAQLRRMITERRVAVLVHNPQTETPVITDLIATARAAGLPVVDATETLPSGQDYLTWMGNQIGALAAVLTRS
jgi:zinc/manganese transport system substrate-binding protein